MPVNVAKWGLLALLLAPVSVAQQRTESGITGIAHFALRVSSLEGERTFLHQLGWEEPFALAVSDSSTEAFFKINDHQFIEIYSRSNPTQETGWMHLCFESDELSSLRKRYVERGLQPTEVSKGGAGNLLFSMHDADGPAVEFTQYMPGSRHSLDRGHHLGPNRISGELVGVRIPARDYASTAKFYVDGLGLHAGEGARKDMFYTDRQEWISGVGGNAGSQAQFVFSVTSVPETRRFLSQHGVAFKERDHVVVVTDPDGNSFIFARS